MNSPHTPHTQVTFNYLVKKHLEILEKSGIAEVPWWTSGWDFRILLLWPVFNPWGEVRSDKPCGMPSPTPTKEKFQMASNQSKGYQVWGDFFQRLNFFVYKFPMDYLTEDSIIPTEPCRLSLAFLPCYVIPFLGLVFCYGNLHFLILLLKRHWGPQKALALLHLLQMPSNLRRNWAGGLLSPFLQWTVGVSRSFKLNDTQFNSFLLKNSQPVLRGPLQRHITHVHTYRYTQTHRNTNKLKKTASFAWVAATCMAAEEFQVEKSIVGVMKTECSSMGNRWVTWPFLGRSHNGSRLTFDKEHGRVQCAC